MRKHLQSYWESTAELVIIFERDLTATRPVAVLIVCTFLLNLQGRTVYFCLSRSAVVPVGNEVST